MIYKGKLGDLKDEYCVVKDKAEHDKKLAEWKKVDKVVEKVEDKGKSENPSKVDEKPAVKKKVSKKKVSKKA